MSILHQKQCSQNSNLTRTGGFQWQRGKAPKGLKDEKGTHSSVPGARTHHAGSMAEEAQ